MVDLYLYLYFVHMYRLYLKYIIFNLSFLIYCEITSTIGTSVLIIIEE